MKKPVIFPLTLAVLWTIGTAVAQTATDYEIWASDTAAYESGKSMEPLRHFEDAVRKASVQPAQRKAVEAGLLRALNRASTFEARKFVCQYLAVVGSEAAVPALEPLLKNEETAGIACLALGNITSSKAGLALRNALPILKGQARIQVVNTLGDRRDTEAVKLLAGLTGDTDHMCAEAAVVVLGKIANKSALSLLSDLRKTANPALADAVNEASLIGADRLISAGNRKEAASIYEQLLQTVSGVSVRRGAFSALLRLDRDQGEQRILKTLKSREADLKPLAIGQVRVLRSETASAKFAAEMPNLKPADQVLLLEALVTRGDKAAREAIQKSLSAGDTKVRLAAIASLGALGDTDSLPSLLQALTEVKTPEERLGLEFALINMPGGTAVDQVIMNTLDGASAEAKPSLFAILARRGNRGVVPLLLTETSNANTAAAKAAYQSLGRLAGATELPAVLDKLMAQRNPDLRNSGEVAAIQILNRVDDPTVRSRIVVAALERAITQEACGSMIRLLPISGSEAAFEALRSRLNDPRESVRETAVRTLADWPDMAAWESLIAIYQQPVKETDRALALRGLVRLLDDANAQPDTRLIYRYQKLLAMAQNDIDRKLILGALGGAAHLGALKLALPLLDNKNIQSEAKLAVKRIAEAVKATDPKAAQEAMDKLNSR